MCFYSDQRTNLDPAHPVSGCPSNLIFNACMSERMSDPTPSPTPSEVTEPADGRGGEAEDLEDLEDLEDDEIFLDHPCLELGGQDEEEVEEKEEEEDEEDEEEDEGAFCGGSSEGQDPFYDRSPIFSVVGRLVRFQRPAGKETSSFTLRDSGSAPLLRGRSQS